MTTKKNYYVCLRFKGRPQTHMTLRYLKDVAPDGLASVTRLISMFMTKEAVCRFTPTFCIEAWYGPTHTVRVLEATSEQHWPRWMIKLNAVMPHTGDSIWKWYPHVACQDMVLTKEVVAVSLMCKKTEVCRWDL